MSAASKTWVPVWLLAWIILGQAGAQTTPEISTLGIFPARLELRGADSSIQLVVSGESASSGGMDLTLDAAYTVEDPSIAAVSASGRVTPLKNGSTFIRAARGQAAASAPIEVRDCDRDLPIHFANDIVPIFSRHGCNSGGCHGKSGGQNGFQLSLFGYVPAVDYAALTRESRGRRIFPAYPDHSLLLQKAAGLLPHGGGARIEPGSPEYRLLARWIRAGAPPGDPAAPALQSIRVFPRRRFFPPSSGGPPRRQQLAVTAVYADGREEDVTALAVFTANDPDYFQVDSAGLVTAADGPGQGTVLARFKGRLDFFQGLIPAGRRPEAFPALPIRQPIDALVFEKQKAMGIAPSALCSDSEYLRRASIDICGAAPTAAECREFLADASPDKRDRLIDRLLERTEYASYFALKWADILRNQRGQDAAATPLTIGFHRWIFERILADAPFDRVVREIICAEGNIADNPAVAWYRSLENPQEAVDDTAQVFLGTRMQCARCHHHPFEKWGQEDYWQFANFYSRLDRRNDRNTRRFTISVRRGKSQLSDDEPTSAGYRQTYTTLKPPGGEAVSEDEGDDPRSRLADWLTSPDNPLFARAVANRYWKHFFGRGIVEPEDDFRDSNPPSNPELLDAIAGEWKKRGFSLKGLVRSICTSTAYQLSAVPGELNRQDRQFFSRHAPRRLPAEVLQDAIDQATGVKTNFRGVLRGMRAIDLPDETSRSYFLDIFGKPARTSSCSCERSDDATLPQVIHLRNSRELQEKLSSPAGRAAQLAADPRPLEEKIDDLFLWVFNRFPTAEEKSRAAAHLGAETGKAASRAWEDLLWALLNAKEFLLYS